MYLRIALIIALVAGLAATGICYTQVKEKIETLQTNLADTTNRLNNTQDKLAKTSATLEETQNNLKQTTSELMDTRAQLTDVTTQRDEINKLAQQKMADLEKTEKSLNDANSRLSRWAAVGMEPEDVTQMRLDLKDAVANNQALLDENALLNKKIVRVQNELDRYTKGEQPVLLPDALKGKVVAVDPKWDFIILDIGEDDGVVERGEVLISRDGKLVGKAKIVTLEAKKAIANIIPGYTTEGEIIMEGDTVMAAKF